jgi:hypothetical protein
MFLRTKERKGRQYLMLVESYRWEGKVKQRTMRNFGPLDKVDWEKYRQILARYNTFYYLNPPRTPTESALRNAHHEGVRSAHAAEPVQPIEKPASARPDSEEQYCEFQQFG